MSKVPMASSRPLVSVVLPTYNRADIICSTIDNILRQTYRNLEIVVVDDGSTDDTQSKLRRYSGRVRVVKQPNAGPAAARNRGIEVASGEVICFQDSDDSWRPTKVARQVSALLQAGDSVPCCLCNSEVQLHDGRMIRSFDCVAMNPPVQMGIWVNVSEVLATRFILFNQAVAIRKTVLEKIGGFDESFRILEDVEMQLRLSLEGPWAVIREPLATRHNRFEWSLSNQESEETGRIYEVKAIERILALKGNERLEEVRSRMERELRGGRRRLKATRLKGDAFWGARALGHGLEWSERVHNALWRRMPWYPKMEVVPLDEVAGAEIENELTERGGTASFSVHSSALSGTEALGGNR